jgi:hypothetical protein
VLEDISRRKHGRLGLRFQDHLRDNTLFTFIWVGIIAGCSSSILGLLLVQSLSAVGTAIAVFFVGALVAMGPGGPRYSEELLDAVERIEIEDLNAQDFIYVKIANDTIRKSSVVNVTIGCTLIVMAPWGHLLPPVLAQGVAWLTVIAIHTPTMAVAEFSFPLAIVYMAAVVPLVGYACFRLVRLVRPARKDASKERH